jgi:calcineurin-like phosphoesterase family protein
MIAPLKIKRSNNQVYLTSDLHLGHAKEFLFGPRGYKNAQEHDEAVIAKINEIVKPEDYLLFCGDFCLNTDLSAFKNYCHRILCQNIIFIFGNHNNPSLSFYKELVRERYNEDIEVYPYRWNNIVFVGESLDVEVDKYTFHLSHFPKLIWDKSHHNRAHGCGHSHGSCSKTLPDNKLGKILDLGWDVFGRPISVDEFRAIMDKKSVEKHDHHNKETT